MKMKKYVEKMLFALVVICCFFSSSSAFAFITFHDLTTNYWGKAEIDFLVEEKIINGYPDGSFKPDEQITRAQAAIMLSRALKLETTKNYIPIFTDVTAEHYAYPEITAAVEAGVFSKGTKFYPNEPITREEVAVAIVSGFKLLGTGTLQFTDVLKSNPSFQAISSLVENDIAIGFPDGTFRPNNKVTRAEFSSFIARSLNTDFLPNQYNIPFNMNPVYIFARFAVSNPEGAQDLFLPSSNFNLVEFSKGIEEIQLVEASEIARLNGETEFSVTFDVILQKGYHGPLVEGENHLYFLLKRLGYMDYRVVSVGTAPHLMADNALSFSSKEALSLFKQANLAYWHVVSGGEGKRDETLFTLNGKEYRYMAETLDTMEKLTDYLAKVYTPMQIEKHIKDVGFVVHHEKLAQPNADGGSLLNWEKAEIIQLNSSTTIRKFELTIPLGETNDKEVLKGELHFVPGVGWRVYRLG